MTQSDDYWVDPTAELCAEIADGCFDALKQNAPASEPDFRYFSLPGISLAVETRGCEAGNLLCAAFEHLERPTPAPAGTSLLWRIGDCALIGEFPDFPAPPRPLHPLGNFNLSDDGALFVERRRTMVSIYDHKQGVVTTLCRSAQELENDVIAKPLLRFLLGILQQQDIFISHAALIGSRGRGLLVTGKGGMGKSTISAASLGVGLAFCSDDFVALQRDGDRIIGHSLYASLLLHPDQLALHPHLGNCARQSRSEVVPKTVVTLRSAFAGQTVASLIVDAIAVPRISPEPHSELTQMSKAAALLALAPTSVFSSPWREVERARFLMGLGADLPCFTYNSGSDFARIPDPVRQRYG
ncbi:hypothetical protein U5922_014375 [Aquicoccus sp. G2-2]|uniref:hypothetical protein n=1 Tax=Aquicoccus sp. G2-2 TaxID=3092120 RepID=UPI002ADF161A|nr:hypothetical protein [Aquicoccus sp. G2-2]MEA1114584.1 hypothetical protein [Aquicoccus sp. G2-2]